MDSVDERRDETFEELGAFFVLKGGDASATCTTERFIKVASHSIESGSASNSRVALPGDEESPSSQVIDFLSSVLDRVIGCVDSLTVVVETHHIDLTYRDLYYSQYSKHLFNMSRFTTRITLFERVLCQRDFTEATESELTECVIGSIVLCPINRGVIGRTIIRPEFIVDEDAGDVDLRLSVFEITVRGKRIRIPGFTYRQQDNEVMSCAEVSLLNLVCYYSNEYNDYSTTTPSEILALEEPLAIERLTPSRGLDFYDMGRIMTGLRFFPRVYHADEMAAMHLPAGNRVTERDWMRRILSWYVSSGIPLAAYVAPETSGQAGHSLVCVGKAAWNDKRGAALVSWPGEGRGCADEGASRAFKLSRRVWEGDFTAKGDARWNAEDRKIEGRKSCLLLDVADLDDAYVVIDDAQLPYSVRPFSGLGPSSGVKAKAFMVPLHRSMVLDALHAHENGMAILENGKAGIFNWAQEDVRDGDRFAIRMFMCSARGYKRSRVSKHSQFAPIYEEMTLSHFLWVFEVFRLEEYAKPDADRRAFAELVLDTSSSGVDNPMNKIVFMRYPRRMYLRNPDGEERLIEIGESISDKDRLIVPYDRNLQRVHARKRNSQHTPVALAAHYH